MDKRYLFQFLSTQQAIVWLNLLSTAYDQMNYDQRQAVFGKIVKSSPPSPIDGAALLNEVELFRGESLNQVYYAPFNVNSRNFMHIPEETNEWFERLGDLLQASCQLTVQKDHLHAVACFGILYELIDLMEQGEEIVFADEIGGWMITGDEKQYIATYMISLAATASPIEFTEAALPLIRRDSWQSFSTDAYASAIRAADEAQRAHLEAEVQRQKIRTPKPTS